MSHISVAAAGITPRAKISVHRILVTIAIVASVLLVLAIVIYGFDYYRLGLDERPFSPKHFLLKPSGKIGIGLGLFGFSLFLVIFLYPIRKRIKWLAVRGSARHWLDFHVVAGSLAPIIIMFHASFKFQGVAGLAFWFMLAVALSGIAGRYLYAQIPPTLKTAENSLKQFEASALSTDTETSAPGDPWQLQELVRIPSAEKIKRMSAMHSIGSMVWLDISLPFLVARLRANAAGRAGIVGTLWGLVPSRDHRIEAVIQNARRRAALAKRVAFLAKSQQVFHVWHVVHRPFSYSFAVLAVIHLVVVIVLGYI